MAGPTTVETLVAVASSAMACCKRAAGTTSGMNPVEVGRNRASPNP